MRGRDRAMLKATEIQWDNLDCYDRVSNRNQQTVKRFHVFFFFSDECYRMEPLIKGKIEESER